MKRFHFHLFLFFLMILFSCNHGSDPAQPDPAYQDSLISWRQNRVRELTMSDGWLALAGRYWLKEGEQSFGAGRGNDIIFPGGTCPDTIGWINLTDDRIFIRIKNGTDVRYEGQPIDVISMITDRDDKQTYLTLGSLKWHIIKRGDRFALRLTDSNSKSLREFRGLEYFPVDPSWCIPAQYVPYDPPKTLLIATVIGTVDTLSAPGYLSFQVGRKAFRLDPVQEPGSGSLFIIFADETTAVETYGGGRFLDASLPDEDGNVILDFNKAYNPPCAFTEFATCPLPPDQNKLAISITAGEKSYSAH